MTFAQLMQETDELRQKIYRLENHVMAVDKENAELRERIKELEAK